MFCGASFFSRDVAAALAKRYLLIWGMLTNRGTCHGSKCAAEAASLTLYLVAEMLLTSPENRFLVEKECS